MSQYVLIHGGDRDGRIWEAVAASLQQQGHTVFCPSMQSVTTASLHENIKQIVDLIKTEQLQDIILIGHSYGAMVITGVADQLPEQIAHLVFIDSVLPQNGQSLYGLLQEYGLDYKALGLTADRACLEPLSFDKQRLVTKSKTYIHCLQSEFLEVVFRQNFLGALLGASRRKKSTAYSIYKVYRPINESLLLRHNYALSFKNQSHTSTFKTLSIGMRTLDASNVTFWWYCWGYR